MIENQSDIEGIQSEIRGLQLRMLNTRSELIYEAVVQHIAGRRDAVHFPSAFFRVMPILPSHRRSLRERAIYDRMLRLVRRRFHTYRRNMQYSQRPDVDTRNWYRELYARLERSDLLYPLQDLGRDAFS